MRNLIFAVAAAASLAAAAFAEPAAAAPIAGQRAVAASAADMLPTDVVRYRHRYFAPRRHRPHVVYRTVYRTRYVYLRAHAHRRHFVRRHRHRYYVGGYAAPIYDYGPTYVAPLVYPQTYYYGGPAYVGGGFGYGGYGGFRHGGYGGFRHGGFGGGRFHRH
ncbi:MAG: hypothetical protein KGM42_08785 [Hyphomicrobiales bacterium]|nr:hypothetical protein [Hyphomicrobiales bacterium]